MTVKKVDTRICDIEGCMHKAIHKCAICGADLCHSEHTHSYGDGGHLEHSICVKICSMDYHGFKEFWICPKCYAESPFYKVEGDYIEGTGGYHAGETMG
jgi:hypothetical protein